MTKLRHRDEELFYEAILTLGSVDACRRFFADICTMKELQAISQRMRVAWLLDGSSNYLAVSESTGASSATISRVNRCLTYGSGYREAIDKLKKAGKYHDDGSHLEQ